VSFGQISRSLLLFWAAWFAVVTTTNIFDALLAAGVLPEGWAFASGNYALIREVTARYGTPEFLLPVLFAAVVAWEGLASILFALAWMAWRADDRGGREAARLAHGVGLGLWAAFLISDELLLAYQVSDTHLRLFIAHVACLVLLSLDDRQAV
jgi:hypothetical protein